VQTGRPPWGEGAGGSKLPVSSSIGAPNPKTGTCFYRWDPLLSGRMALKPWRLLLGHLQFLWNKRNGCPKNIAVPESIRGLSPKLIERILVAGRVIRSAGPRVTRGTRVSLATRGVRPGDSVENQVVRPACRNQHLCIGGSTRCSGVNYS
jgi:hypothetical protein